MIAISNQKETENRLSPFVWIDIRWVGTYNRGM